MIEQAKAAASGVGPAGGRPLAPRASRREPLRLRSALAIWLGAVLPACAPTINYSEPDGPRYGTARSPAGAADTGFTPAQLTVVTFNIRYGRHVDRAIDVLRAPPLRGADVISLQEIDADGASRIADALGMHYVYYPSVVHPVGNRQFGPAVLARWPIEHDWKLLLPHPSWGRGQLRTVTAAVLRVGTARVRVYALHLELPIRITPAGRNRQVERILCDARDAPEPVVIAGDFNGPDVAWLFEREGYHWASRSTGPTAGVLHLDHIFARGLEPPGPLHAGVVTDTRGASDHRPLWAVFTLPDSAAPAAPRATSLRCDP
ncbi:MAG TPA: endonuclease/exonuclease/phosphatase family protein [Longimicrobiales bacterium]|nr:endonuclease/exonuclease/phosphatase family protein [Longimicrobiales bacterium]